MNMDVGSEISCKIRSAIKAKLVELNAYVDEELPDYIMVMVANKKSQLQMSEDLGLFLGANTEKFTGWLHGLLQKLQSITSESSAAAFISEKTVEKTKSGEQAASEVLSGKHRKHSEKQSSDESKSKKRTSDEGSDDKKHRKRQKSDPKSKTEDDVKSKQVPDKEEQDVVCTSATVEASDSVSAKSALSESSAVSDKDNLDKVSVSQQAEKTVTQVPEKDLLDAVSGISENELLEIHTAQSAHSKQVSNPTVDVSDIQVEDDDLSDLLFTENDELTEELEQEAVNVIVPIRKSDSGRAAVILVSDNESSTKSKRGTSSSGISSESSKAKSPPQSSRPRAVTSPIRQTARRSALVEPRQSELLTRKRRAPVSVIGSVTRDSDEEEGYDPRNPAVGSVASIVKVTARKSSVPPKLQANKSLLLKAMTEAEKSVENQRRVAITPIKPFLRSEGRERDRDRGRDHDRRSHSSSSRESRRHSPTPRIAQASLRQAISQPRSSRHSPPVYIPTRKVEPALRVESSDRVGIVSKSRRQEAHERAWLEREEEAAPPRKCIKTEKATPIVNFVIESTEYDAEEDVRVQHAQPDDPPTRVKKEPVSPQKKLSYTEASGKPVKNLLDPERDSRVVEFEPEVVGSPAERSLSESGSQGVPALLEDMDQEEFLLDQDVLEVTESSVALPEEDHRQAMMKDKSKDRTRFVVTLDGVETDQYGENPMETEVVEEEMEVDKLQAMKVKASSLPPSAFASQFVSPPKDASPALMTPPKIQPLNINLKDSDEEGEAMETEITPLRKAKMMERCKFWPACVNGSACDYHHPTIHCKTFPNCKFGDKCLYIHPNCRFDFKCVRPDCPFTHSSVRSFPAFQAPPFMKPAYIMPPPPVIPAQSMVTPPACKFFPKCTNMACPFLHPKACRFGMACKNKEKGCPFFHPALPTADKLTWVASKGASATPAGVAKEVKKTE